MPHKNSKCDEEEATSPKRGRGSPQIAYRRYLRILQAVHEEDHEMPIETLLERVSTEFWAKEATLIAQEAAATEATPNTSAPATSAQRSPHQAQSSTYGTADAETSTTTKVDVMDQSSKVQSKTVESLYDSPTLSYSTTKEECELQNFKKNLDNHQNQNLEQHLPSDEPSTSSSNVTQQGAVPCSQEPPIMKYKVRPGTIDQGRDYEFKITALILLRCVNRGVKDMWVASNPDDIGDFDDIVLHVDEQDGKETTFMLQLKHKDTPKNITKAEFLGTKGDFALSKYTKDISNLHKSITKPAPEKSDFVIKLGKFKDVFFVLFTNRGTYDLEFLEKHLNTPVSFLNTNSNAQVYKVDVIKVPDLSSEIVSDCNLFLLSDQFSVKQLDDVIIAEVKKISNTLEISNLNIKDVSKGFILYVTEWAKGILGGHYCLTRKDVLYKLTELFLNQYTLNLKAKPFLNNENDKLQIWNQVIANHPITVVDYSDLALKFLIQFVSTEVQKHCEGPVENWVEQLSKEEQQIFYNNHLHLKQHILKHVGNHGRIRPLDIYKSLWRVKTLPLLLKVSDPSHFQNISKIVKFSNYSYKVVVLHESLTLPCREGEAKQQHEEVNEQIIKSFKTLKDLDKKERNKILQQKVKLQGRPGAILGDILNEEMLQHVTSKDILDILTDDFNIGNEIQEPVEYIIERTIITKGVDREVLRNFDKEIFLILGKFEDSLDILSSLDEYKIFDINHIDLDNLKNIPEIINIHEAITSYQLEKLQKTKKSIHILSVYDSNYLEWMWSYGNTKTIEIHEVQLKYEVNQEHIARLLSTAAIISDVPGMGKSVLTNYIAYHAPVNKWVLKVDLNTHQSYFRQRNTSSRDALAHLRYFYETACSRSDRNSEFSRLIFEDFVNLKKIAILLDGFDEVAASYKDQVTNMAKSLYAEGFQVLITTRPNMKQHLEETFKKTSISIMPFTVEHQTKYLTNFFTSTRHDLNVLTVTKIQMFVERLIKMVSRNLNDLECEFMGIPLQTCLLANVFNSECEEYVSSTSTTDFNNKCDLLYLYDKFIENKIKIFMEKYGDVAYEQHEVIREHQALLAIKLIFPLKQIIESDILKKVYQPLTVKPKLIQLLQREGIMIVDEKGNITCVHRTIAEFLAAQWLSDNLQNTNEAIKKFVHDLIIERFTRNYKFLFYIFDRILSQNCPLHLAIINKEIMVALDIINSDSEIVNVSDKGGRSALHIVALNGLQYSLPYNRRHRYSEKDEMLAIAQKLLCDTITMKTDVLGYTSLDYALASCSLQIANELCTNNEAPIIYIYISLQYQKDYLKYCELKYYKLFQTLLPYFVSRDLLQNNIKTNTIIAKYYDLCVDRYKKTNRQLLQSISEKAYSGFKNESSVGYYSDLRHAIACGSTNNVQQLLQHEETEINETDMDNNTLLHYAVIHGRSEIVKLLLEKNARVNKQNKDLNTPLHLSLLNCDINITNMLLSKKVNLDSVNIKGATVLHLAFSNSGNKIQDKNLFDRYSAVVRHISSKCSNINSENNAGETPLHYSVKNGYSKDIINYLLLRNADINKMSHNEQTPLHFALIESYYEIVKFLVENGADVNAQDGDGYTSLIWAAEKGSDETVKFLVENGADVNAQNGRGYTPLIWAVKNGSDKIVKFLVDNGAAVNAQNRDGYTPIIWAAENSSDEIVKFLVENGAAINAQNAYGYTPLIWAAEKSSGEIVKFLVKSGADVNAQNEIGPTALTCAAQNRNDEIVKFLVENRANVNAQDGDGSTALIWGTQKRNYEIVKFLVENRANVNAQNRYGYTSLIYAAEKGSDEIVKFLVENGADVNAQDNDGSTPLIWAAQKRSDEIVKFLVSNGTDVNAQDGAGYTPLIWAAQKCSDEIVKFLVENGADVNAQDGRGYTPLIWTVKQGSNKIVKFLIANGANVNAQHKGNKTLLFWAMLNGHYEIKKFLRENGAF